MDVNRTLHCLEYYGIRTRFMNYIGNTVLTSANMEQLMSDFYENNSVNWVPMQGVSYSNWISSVPRYV